MIRDQFRQSDNETPEEESIAALGQVQQLLKRLADGKKVQITGLRQEAQADILREVADSGLHKLYSM